MNNFDFAEVDLHILNLLLNSDQLKLSQILNSVPSSESLTKKSLSKIDKFLTSNNFGTIRIKRGIYCIQNTFRTEIQELVLKNFKYSKEDRIFLLLYKLITQGKVVLSQEAENLKLNRKTLQLDIAHCKALLKNFDLSVKSRHSKYVEISGREFPKYIVLIKLVVKIIMKKEFFPYKGFYAQLFTKKNIPLYRDLYEQIRSLTGFNINFKYYCGIVAIFAISDTFPQLNKSKCLPKYVSCDILKYLEKYVDKFLKIKNTLVTENIYMISRIISEVDVDFFERRFQMDYNDANKFITIFEKVYGDLSNQNRMILYNLINNSVFEKRFGLLEIVDNNSFHSHVSQSVFKNTVSNMLKFSNIDISENAYLKIILFLKSIIRPDTLIPGEYPKEILIMDGTLNFWMGNIIRNHLLSYYEIDKVDIEFFQDDVDTKAYDLIFRLEVPENRISHWKFNSEKIDWLEFKKNRFYFKKFKLKEL